MKKIIAILVVVLALRKSLSAQEAKPETASKQLMQITMAGSVIAGDPDLRK